MKGRKSVCRKGSWPSENRAQEFPPYGDNVLNTRAARLISFRVFSWVPLKHHGQRSSSQELASQQKLKLLILFLKRKTKGPAEHLTHQVICREE